MSVYELHKGYVPTRDKKCLMKFKGKGADELLRYDEVKKLPEFAGILNDNTVLIDVDDSKQYEMLLEIVEELDVKCKVYKSTHGGHFLFLNDGMLDACKTHNGKWMTAIGLDAVDIKLGSKTSYSVLKFDGKEREVVRDSEEYQTVPKWLCPVRKAQDFIGMKSGDGRNQALFNYILTLQSAGFSKQEAIETIHLINRFILPDPLPEKELDTILRDESFQKPIFFDGKEFRFDIFAKFMMSEHNIIRIGGELHIYEDGIYKRGERNIGNAMIKHIPKLSKMQRSEVLAYLDVLIRKTTPQADAQYIAFKNGIYNINTNEFSDFDPKFVIVNKIPHNYNPHAYSELVDKSLNKLAVGDQDIRALLEESIGYTFYRRNELRKFFMLTGDKRNGKSTYIEMLNALLGDENTTALDMAEISTGGFKTAELINKMACTGDDIDGEYISKPGMLKKLISGGRANVERKYKDPQDFSNYAKMFFSANEPPKVKDKTGAFLDRMIVIPFNAVFSEDDPDYDPYIKYKLIEEPCMEYLILLGIKGLNRVLDRYKFTSSKKLESELAEYRLMNDPILLFFEELDLEVDVLNKSTSRVFMKYSEFCITNGFKPTTQVELTKHIKKEFGYDTVQKRVDGQRVRVFTN